MSLFDYPRINIKGTLQLNPGTANNDDYAGYAVLPDTWGPFAGETLALIDSKKVEARTYGMSDEAFIAWTQKAQTFDIAGKPGETRQIIPAEWNYYGDMGSQILEARVIGVQTDLNKIYSQPTASVPLSEIIGADLTFSGSITDVNSEGSPPATQFFIDHLELKQGNRSLISGQPSKGTGQWINFYRNVNLAGDSGAGTCVYHILEKTHPKTCIQIPQYQDSQIAGVIFRYYLYHSQPGTHSNARIEALYEQKKDNPATLEIVATIAPLYQSEKITTAPTGRLMTSNTPNIPTPQGSQNNSSVSNDRGLLALAPAVLQNQEQKISADFSGTFPDYFLNGANPKYDFGPVLLIATSGTQRADIGTVEYANTAEGDRKGWIFDFDISANTDARKILQNPNARFALFQPSIGNVLEETDYYFVSNQQSIYAEQFGPGAEFLNQGAPEPATVSVYHRGQELSADTCPPITLWQYRSIPLQAPGDAEVLSASFKPGQPIQVDTGQPGNFLFTFTINDTGNPAPAGYPPKSYTRFMNPPFITNAPSISLRILPNDEDFSKYYIDPDADEPVGNDLLTFDVVFTRVLRTYYLLYPIMNAIFPLNSGQEVAKHARAILKVTEQSIWMSTGYMPRTRDLSASRRTLLRAWCRKVLQSQ